jgi:hypothetical protein
MSRIGRKYWYTTSGGHTIGIIESIGVGDGFNETIDVERIARHGARFRPELWSKNNETK